MPDPITIFISAGEASGEHYGALLTAVLQRRLAEAGVAARFIGMAALAWKQPGWSVLFERKT